MARLPVLDVQLAVQAAMSARQRPEVVSVMVTGGLLELDAGMVRLCAPAVAAQQYPGMSLGQVLWVGMHELGQGLHEVLVEVLG